MGIAYGKASEDIRWCTIANPPGDAFREPQLVVAKGAKVPLPAKENIQVSPPIFRFVSLRCCL